LYVDKSQAYPKVLETLWNAESKHQQIEVMNLGFPGTNSSKLVKDFRRLFWAFRPDLVTVMIGGNDFWTMPEGAADSPDWIDRFSAALWKVSRVYRLLYMVRRAVDITQLEITLEPSSTPQRAHATARYGQDEFDLGWTSVPNEGVPGWNPVGGLKRNLESLVAQANELGTQLVFVTYASDSGVYAWANGIIRDVARTTGSRLIDVTPSFKPLCPDGKCSELFPDQHPTVNGHERLAQMLRQQLLPQLEQPK
jgi:lysophospholipase L1-like esterase